MMTKNKKYLLWYQQGAGEWIEALPIGNGRIGAMVYGCGTDEVIQIDESSFWSGEHSDDNDREDTRALMEEIREALLKKDYELADRLGHGFVGNKNQYGTNMPTGELKLTISEDYETTNLVRSLDIENSLALTEFSLKKENSESFRVTRECFVSNPDQIFALHMTSEHPLTLRMRYDGVENNTVITKLDGRSVFFEGDARETLHSNGTTGVHMEGCMELIGDGSCSFEKGEVTIEACSELVIFMDLATTMFHENPLTSAREHVLHSVQKGYDICREDHIEDVRELFDRMTLDLGGETMQTIPVDQRIRNVQEGMSDPDLFALMYQYGRYLLIASSREDSPLPTHMGGIWNDNIYNNIDCTQDMHIDMNLQMQYWAAAQCNLPECETPFFRYVRDILVPNGRISAKKAYGMDGWTAHVVSNPWGFTALGWAYNWGAWSLGGVWCSAMILDYYRYSGDREFLEGEGFSILEGAVRFVLDYVFYDNNSGFYMCGPSYSPENQYSVNGRNYFLALSNTCDVLLIREILENYQEACEILGKKTQWLEKAKEVHDRLPDYQIGAKGQLQEWFYDYDEPIPNHRHTSHLLGLYPFSQIDGFRDQKLADAARRTIELRHENFEITSWGMNMLMGYYARLGEGEKAAEILKETFARIVRPNMASVMDDETSMWRGTWELDGNTGLTAAMSEMFLQSRKGELRVLPALPSEWKEGSITGLRAQYLGTVDVYWSDHSLQKLVIYPEADQELVILYHEREEKVSLKAGEVYQWGE